MDDESNKLLRAEFEARIVISLLIAAGTCVLSFSLCSDMPPTLTYLAALMQISPDTAISTGFLVLAVVMAAVSTLRMWAGSVLSPERVMAYSVQADSLVITGPYRLVRHPIYLADLLAMCVFALCLPLVGLLLPTLFFAHYCRLIRYEEDAMAKRLGHRYTVYSTSVARLIPRLTSVRSPREIAASFTITRAGFRHNALFTLFVPGLVVAAFTHEFIHAVIIGLPAVVDWAIVHMRVGSKGK